MHISTYWLVWHFCLFQHILGRGFFYNFIFKIKKSVSLFCASTGGLSRRYLKSNPKPNANSELFLKGHLQVGLISICKCYGFIFGMRLTNHFRSRNHCRQEIMSDPRCFCSSAHPLPHPPIRPFSPHFVSLTIHFSGIGQSIMTKGRQQQQQRGKGTLEKWR